MRVKITMRVKENRERQKLSIRQLADISGVSKTTISAIERGSVCPTIYTIALLAYALNTRPELLYEAERCK